MKKSMYFSLFLAVILGSLAVFAGCAKEETGSGSMGTVEENRNVAAPKPVEEEKTVVSEKPAEEEKHKPSGQVVEITSTGQLDKILADNSVVLVQLYADWCGPCQMLKPRTKEIAKDYAGKIVVAQVNVDNNRDLTAKYKVRGIPDVRIFNNGKEAKKVVGLQPKKNYTDYIDSLLK
jgi:thioredoxin 1